MAKALLSLVLAALAVFTAAAPAHAQITDHQAELEAACQLGDLDTCVTLGREYAAEGSFSDAEEKFRHACEQGTMSGCHEASPLYRLGLGGVDANPEFATQLYRHACENSYGPSCSQLGRIYADGEGVAQDYVMANQLFGKGCDLKDGLGCFEMGARYYKGIGGVERDDVKALGWFLDACLKGYEKGCAAADLVEHDGE